jgi:elongation factor 3
MLKSTWQTVDLILNSPRTTAWEPSLADRKSRVSTITASHHLHDVRSNHPPLFYSFSLVVLAAAMWNQPHILILDEPTNYLDRESLGALANAITAFEGGVVIISHNNEFVSTLCPEEWVMDAGNLTTKGEVGWMNRQDDKISDAPVITEMTDALGNTSEVKQAKKAVSKRDEKALLKALRKKIAQGEELDEAEEEMAVEHDLL